MIIRHLWSIDDPNRLLVETERGNLATFTLTPSRVITEDDLTDVTSPLTKDLYLASVHADEITGIWRKLYLYGFEYTTTPQSRYDAANTIQVKLKLGKATDADILKKLDEIGNKQGYIKALIRADIEKNEK